MIPNRIVLISHGRHDEAPAGVSNIYPGMVLSQNSSLQVIPHNVVGGGPELLVCEEDAWQGKDITQALNSGGTGDTIPFRRPVRGDELLMLLQNGQSVAAMAALMSAGDGTLIADPGAAPLYEIVAPSTVVTNVGTETTFSNGSYTLPANFLQVGDVLKIRAKAFLIAVNSTNTHRVRLYIGSVTIADSTAESLVASDFVLIDATITVRTITSSGTIIADGVLTYTISGTATDVPFTVASSTLDSTVTETIRITTLASATSAGNQMRLDEFRIDLERENSNNFTLVKSMEAVNNSGGTGTSGFNSAAFIRCLVP